MKSKHVYLLAIASCGLISSISEIACGFGSCYSMRLGAVNEFSLIQLVLFINVFAIATALYLKDKKAGN